MNNYICCLSFIGHIWAYIKIGHNRGYILNFLVTFLLLTTNKTLYFPFFIDHGHYQSRLSWRNQFSPGLGQHVQVSHVGAGRRVEEGIVVAAEGQVVLQVEGEVLHLDQGLLSLLQERIASHDGNGRIHIQGKECPLLSHPRFTVLQQKDILVRIFFFAVYCNFFSKCIKTIKGTHNK